MKYVIAQYIKRDISNNSTLFFWLKIQVETLKQVSIVINVQDLAECFHKRVPPSSGGIVHVAMATELWLATSTPPNHSKTT